MFAIDIVQARTYTVHLSPNKNRFDDTSVVHRMNSSLDLLSLEEFRYPINRELSIPIMIDKSRDILLVSHMHTSEITVAGIQAPIQTPKI